MLEYLLPANPKLCLAFVALGLWSYWLWSRRHFYRFAYQFPGFYHLPIIGVFAKIHARKDVIPVFTQMFAACKHYTICIWFGFYPILLTVDPDVIGKILSSPEFLNKAQSIYRPLYNFFGGGLVANSVKNWQPIRKLIIPSFSPKVLLTFLPVFHKARNSVICKFDALVGTGEHKLFDMLQRMTLGVSVETTMGKQMREGEQLDDDLIQIYQFVMEKATTQILVSFLGLGGIFNIYRRFMKYKFYLRKFVAELVESRRKTLTELNNRAKETETSVTGIPDEAVPTMKKTPNIFIDHALSVFEKQQLSYNDIIAESNSMVIAAFETSANSIFSTLLMLAMHPEVQEKLYQEVVSLFPEKDFEMSIEHMDQLPYLEMVINETLRLMPPFPLIGRQVNQQTQLTEDLVLPKDMQIIIPIFHLHRRTDVWGPNANKFDPDNFLPQNMVGRHPYAFIPFSKGMRNCIGFRYAILSLKVILCGLVRNFSFSTSCRYEDLRWEISISLKYVKEPKIEIHRRD